MTEINETGVNIKSDIKGNKKCVWTLKNAMMPLYLCEAF